MDHLENFQKELRDNGYEPVSALRLDGATWNRLRYMDEKTSQASGGCKITVNPDGTLYANYGSQKDKNGFRSWKSDKTRELSWQEISSERAARASHKRFIEERDRKRHELVGQRLTRVLMRLPVASGDHLYLAEKRVQPFGIRVRPKTGELLVPRYGIDGRIYSLQRIMQKKAGIKSWKGYFKGALGKDLYYPMMGDARVIVLCEGFATGASIHQATGLSVIVCFDTGALGGVARGMKARYPDARIVLAADNDQWVFAAGKKPKDLDTSTIAGDDDRWLAWRNDGALFNPGVEKARAAAAGIGGAYVLIPDFVVNHAKKLTDFNDLACEKGGDYVKSLFDRALEIPRVTLEEEAAPAGFGSPSGSDVQTGGRSDFKNVNGDMGMGFRVLGYNNGVYYYYPFSMRQIVALSATGHSMANLMQLDALDRWEASWRQDGKLNAKHQTIALYAAAAIMQIAEKRGVFMEESSVRGAGTWIDDGRTVMHCGDSLYVEGKYTKFDDLKSEFTYVAAAKLMRPARQALDNSEARRLRAICEAVTWENPLSGTLLAGWLVIAPVCAALRYRPHIYITGEAESGKSTVVDRIIKPVLGKMGLCVDGGTTEPAIRDAMGYDARPLIYDEAETSPSMADVIALARKASTGAVVKKHGQRAFKANFCACFSAINPPVNKTADESRISFMHLKKNRRSTAMEEYDRLEQMIEEVITPDFAARMTARTLENMQTLIDNIRIFQRAVRKVTGGARASQQIGTMLAGVYLLGSTALITEEKAMEIVRRFNYADHTIIEDVGDPIRLVQYIAGALVKGRSGKEESIGDLITETIVGAEGSSIASAQLKNYGIKIVNDRVMIASRCQNLGRLLRDTEWSEKWNRTLSDVPGAEKFKIEYFRPALKTSGVSLPAEMFYERTDELPLRPSIAEEIPFDDVPWPEGRE